MDCYIFLGIVLVGISQAEKIVLFSPLFSWFILVLTLAVVCVSIWWYTKFRQKVLRKFAEGSDLKVLPHGLITYERKLSKMSSEGLSKGIVGTTVGQVTLPAGQLSVKVSSSAAKSTSNILLTPLNCLEGSLWVMRATGGFTINNRQPEKSDVLIAYFIIN
jgi:hypothetical protein